MTTQQNTNTYFSKPKNTRKIMKITQQIFSALALIAITANINLPINSKLPNLFDGVKASASSGNISPTVDCSGSGGAYSNLPSTPTASNYTLNTPINTNLTFNSAMFDTGFVAQIIQCSCCVIATIWIVWRVDCCVVINIWNSLTRTTRASPSTNLDFDLNYIGSYI